MLTSRSNGARRVTSRPWRRIRPSVGSSKPAIIRSVVVLPEPDGPSIEKNSPSRTSRSMPSTAATSPNRFVTPSSRTAGSVPEAVRAEAAAVVAGPGYLRRDGHALPRSGSGGGTLRRRARPVSRHGSSGGTSALAGLLVDSPAVPPPRRSPAAPRRAPSGALLRVRRPGRSPWPAAPRRRPARRRSRPRARSTTRARSTSSPASTPSTPRRSTSCRARPCCSTSSTPGSTSTRS